MTNPNAIPLATAIEHRDVWLAASLALATAQEYTISTGGSSRHLIRADLAEVRKQLAYWEAKVRSATPGMSRVRFGVPH